MGSNNIEKLLDAYFEGNTSLEEEAILMDYFNNHRVEDHLLQYKPIFVGLAAAKREKSSRDFQLPGTKASSSRKPWRYAVAAILVVALGMAIFFNSQSRVSQQEKEALVAFENSKRAMIFLSEKFNKGVEQLSYVEEFTIAKDMVFEKD